MRIGFAVLLLVGIITFLITNCIPLALLAVIITIITLPPKYDPAIQLKERLNPES